MVKPKEVKTPERAPRSPGRTKTPASLGRPKSPSKSKPKSPARKSPSRKASASRVKKDVSPVISPILKKRPSRKQSPSRPSKIPVVEKTPEPKITNAKPKVLIEIDSDSDSEYIPTIKEKPKAAVRGRSRIIEAESDDFRKLEGLDVVNSAINDSARRMTRYSHTRETERIVHLKSFDTSAKKLSEFSDEDEAAAATESVPPAKRRTFGELLGNVLNILLFPAFLLSLQVVCNELKCSFTSLDSLTRFKRLKTYFDSLTCLCYFGYLIFLVVVSILPLGGRRVSSLPNKYGKVEYVKNGLFVFTLTLAICVGLEIGGYKVASFIITHFLHFNVAAIVVGTVLALALHVKSTYLPYSKLNVEVAGKSALTGLVNGNEVNPRFFKVVDVKFLSFRAAIITCLLIDLAFLYKSVILQEIPADLKQIWEYKVFANPTLLVLFALHLVYFLDSLILEDTWLSTLEFQNEGFGYFSAIGYLASPFYICLTTKYVFYNGIRLPTWQLVLTTIIFLTGFVLYRGSNNQKNTFRRNPYHPSVANLETLSTSQGKKLLISGFWGKVRHPNYLGDILINIAFLPFCLCAPASVAIYVTIAFLICRTRRDHLLCKQKYGSAWDRYCQKVKYVLIPKIY